MLRNRLNFVVVVLLVTGLTRLPRACEAAGQVRCLLVGIDDYGGVGDLEGCVEDVRQMETFLKRRFGPQRTTVKSLQDRPGDGVTVTWADIDKEIKSIAQRSTDEDFLYFYFSGHGAGDSSLQLPSEQISPQKLAAALAKVPAKLTCVIVDSCFSGGLVADLSATIKTPQLIVATAVQKTEMAKTCGQGGCPANSTRGSVFTRWLVNAMSDRSNDENQDGVISWREASQVATREIAAQRYRQYLSGIPGFTLAVERSLAMTPVFYQRL